MLDSDSYKFGHPCAYLPGTQYIYSYLEARKGAKYNKTLWFGLQYILMNYLAGEVVTKRKIEEAKWYIDQHLGPGVFIDNGAYSVDGKKIFEGWNYILEKYNGKLPVRIKAVPEGTLVDIGNVLMTVENTDPNVPWLTNYLETILMHVWYPTTVATQDWETKELLKYYLDRTSATNKGWDGLPFMLHGFGMRAATSLESCAIADAAHLINFQGTDTVPALKFIEKWYSGNTAFPGYSVFATEHSIMTSRGEDGEWDVLENILKNKPNGIISIVIDSYNYQRFVDMCGTKYKDIILNRNGRTVFRPDSGDPITVTLDVLNRLGYYFGFERNKGNFKVLNDKVRVLWGDGIDYEGIRNVLFALFNEGWAAENMVFGMGGHMVQAGLTRDTMRFAFKCSAQMYNNEWHDVWKEPLDLTKASKRGRLALIHVQDANCNRFFKTIREEELQDGSKNRLVTVFENGEIKKFYSFDQIRQNVL